MDFTQNDFRNWMEELFCPTILVRTTEDVEQMCLKNNLNFIDLLRPYERVKKDSMFFLFLFIYTMIQYMQKQQVHMRICY